ncbi:MAG: glycosyltransferase family 4 protein [Bacteroidia bacterium]|nr:glycosyltransferase family 4 protein [Bacteroidia bacterium]
MKHILFISPGFADGISDSKCIPCLQQFALHLSKTPGIKISILSLEYPFEEKEYDWNGITVYACGGKNRSWPLKSFNLKNALQKIKKINSDRKIDLINSFWFQDTALLGNFFCKRNEIPHVVTLMGQDVLAGNKYLRFFKNVSAKFICLSPFQQAVFKKNSGQHAEVIPLGIDEKEFGELNTGPRAIDVLGAGGLSPVKQFNHFIEVIGLVKEKNPSIKAVLIGDGSEKENLLALTKKMGLQNNILFTGALERDLVLEYMQKSKILLHTSSFESFGYVFTEALASGMKIVSYPVGIATEASINKAGNNIHELSEIISFTLKTELSPEKSIPFPIGETIRKYCSLYRSLLN